MPLDCCVAPVTEFVHSHLAVGLAAVQIAKAIGAKVIATAGSEEKLKVAKSFGADYGINYNNEGWQKEVMKITQGHGADVVYDPVGMIVPSLKCIAWNGRLIIVGFAAGSIEKVSFQRLTLFQPRCQGRFSGTNRWQPADWTPLCTTDSGEFAPAQERGCNGRALVRDSSTRTFMSRDGRRPQLNFPH